MKSRILRKLCVYAVSASMMLPASAPVMAATTTSVVRDYSFNLSEMNYTNAVLYEGDQKGNSKLLFLQSLPDNQNTN